MIELPIVDAAEAQDENKGVRFWRSQSHREGAAAYRELARHEFVPGATDGPSGTTRRQFMQLMGASMALAGLTACRRPVERIMPYVRRPEEVIPGIPMTYASAMPFRGVLRPLLVESHEGRPTKVEGNPEHPESQGKTGPFAQASILNLYDPDRSQFVLRNGSAATWQAFLDFAQQFSLGAGTRRMAVLAAPSSSPTQAGLRQALAQQYPGLRWVTYTAEGPDAAAEGMRMAFGQPYRPRYDFAQAQVIVSLDADFLGPTERDLLHNTRTFTQGHTPSDPSDTMSRLYVVESTFSTTGGMADNRLRLRSSEIAAFAAALAARLGVGGGPAGPLADHPWVIEIANDLRRAGSRGVVLAGDTQPAEVHALCAALNAALGAVGQTMMLLDTGTANDTTDLAGLIADMAAGNVDALLMLDVNPVYDAPMDLGFVSAMRSVPETIHLGLHVDETAMASTWHLPMAHYLEAWGDGRAYDGTLSVIQPLIAPLYDDAKSDLEVLSALAEGVDQAGYDLVRERWQQVGVLSGDFEASWRRVLHDGFLPNTSYATATAAAAATPALILSVPGDDLEVVFRLDPTVLDGRYANNAWMQELPDPTTKVVWDNVALMSPATAEALGLDNYLDGGKYYADLVALTIGGETVEVPTWVQPGVADGSIQLTLGYGRTIASNRAERDTNLFDLDDYTDIYGHGALGTGVGVNVSPLRLSTANRVAIGVQAAKSGEGYMIASTQDHGAREDEINQVMKRGLVRMATLEEWRAQPEFVKEEEPHPIDEPWEDYPELWDEHPSNQPAYKDNPYYQNQWGMVIDLGSCTGCNVCVVACQAENNIQVVGKEEVANGREMSWIRLDRYFYNAPGQEDNPQMALQPLPCMHCENAPCESVCPVAATVHSPDGTNQMIYNRCIGTRYCANNCPYKVRRFNYYNWTKDLPIQVQMAQNPNVTVRSRGVMEKCSYCIQRVREANKHANLEDRPLRDGEVVTACQQACPASAITFGDLTDPNSAIVQKKLDPRRYELLAELAVKPRTSYLGRVRNPNPRLEATV